MTEQKKWSLTQKIVCFTALAIGIIFLFVLIKSSVKIVPTKSTTGTTNDIKHSVGIFPSG